MLGGQGVSERGSVVDVEARASRGDASGAGEADESGTDESGTDAAGTDAGPTDAGEAPPRPSWRRRWTSWHAWLLAIVAAALALRVGYVLKGDESSRLTGDATYYHIGGNLLAEGKGFIHPLHLAWEFRVVEGADHPPAYIVYLAGGSLAGLRTFFAHQVWSCLLGAATVGVLGFTGRRIAGPAAGLTAAAIAAVLPTMWIPDGWLISETMAMFAVALVVLAAYRWWDRPTRAATVALGAALGLAALSRSELVLLAPLLAVPLVWFRRRDVRRAAASLALVGLTALAVVSPWVIHNLTRFDHVVLLSDQGGQTTAASWCDDGFYGPNLGYRSYACLDALRDEEDPPESWTSYGLSHIERVPLVMTARVARVWGVFRPDQQIRYESFQGPAPQILWAAFAISWVLLPLAVVGARRLRRARVPLVPLLAPAVVATLAIALTFGQLRYRAPLEPALALLVGGLWARPRPVE